LCEALTGAGACETEASLQDVRAGHSARRGREWCSRVKRTATTSVSWVISIRRRC